MLRSMTAYGRASISASFGQIFVEIYSLNRRYLEIYTSLPRELNRFEIDIRKWISEAISRGHVNIRISVHYENKTPMLVSPNLPLAKQLKDAWKAIAAELNVKDEKDLLSQALVADKEFLLTYLDAIEDTETYREALHKAISDALDELIKMKTAEGEILQEDITARLNILQQKIDQIEKKGTAATDRYREKLVETLEKILPGAVENEDRILREVAVYAERIDTTEEIVRFKSHVKQFQKLLNSSDPALGKTLDFLLQEMNREINTIGSKSAEGEISHRVVEMKSELEKIREQIQNVE
jgi:uncharacterized protein (TIGR00255 family)